MNSASTRTSLVVAVIVGLTVLPSAWGQPSVLFAEPFEETLERGWDYVRGHRQSRKLEAGKLHVRTRPGSLYQAGNNARNILLRTLPRIAKPMLVEVEIEFRPLGLHENAGIVYYVDDDNYAIITMGAHLEGENAVRFQMLHEIEGNANQAHDAASSGAHVFLGMRVTDDELIGMYRYTSTGMWEVLGSVPCPPGVNPRIGIAASNGALDIENWARFDNFRIMQLE